jgi:Secretion system C-terminal sorting domain
LIFACSFSIEGQDTFHKLIYFDYPGVPSFRGVHPTDSCYYVVGNTTDSTFTSVVIFAKVDLEGELLFHKYLQHPGTDYYNTYSDLSGTPNGNLLSCGDAWGDEGLAQLRIFDTNGDTLLTKGFKNLNFPDQIHEIALEVRQNEKGGYAMLISFWADDSPSDVDISLVVLDSLFQTKFYDSYASTSMDEISNSLILDNDGGYLIGAKRTNEAEVLLNYNCRTLIVKVDSSGGQAWQWLSPAGVLQDEAKAMIKTPDGGLVVASGIGQEIGNNPNIHTLVWDGLVFKLDADRNVVWSTPLRASDVPGGGGTELTEMMEAADGNGYVASGIVYEITPEHPNGYYTSWLVKVSPEGDSLWSRRYTYFNGEFVAPEVFDMKATPDGGYVLVGFTVNQYDAVTNPIVPAWIMKVDSFGCLIPGCHLPNAIGEKEAAAPSLVVYPNPVSDFLTFQLRGVPFTKNATFRIVNMEGKVMEEIKSVNVQATVTVPVSVWPVGVYSLQCLENEVVICSEKFVKQ